jgi:hypothetical protein
MPSPRITDEAMRQAHDLVRKHGTVLGASQREGIPRGTLENRYNAAMSRLGLPDIRKHMGGLVDERPPPEPVPEPTFEKPRVRVAADGGEIRVCAIGDVHAGPGMPTNHLGWIAAHIIETKPAHIVQIGDFGDWHSVSGHEGNDTLRGRMKPSFSQDEEAVHEAYHALYTPLDHAGIKARRHETKGNHCWRVDRFVNEHPELRDDWDLRARQLPARFGVDQREFGEWLFIGGVGFTHVPMNVMGKPYGGKTVENQIANDAVFSIVSGHSHRANVVHRAKIGPHGSGVTILNLGTAMPAGHIPPYARWSTTGWSYGIFDLRIANGHITGHSFTSIDDLARRYG